MPFDDPSAPESEVDISVIVPVHNSAAGIRVTLDALTKQDYPRSKFEVLVVDNCSSDLTPNVAGEYVQSSNRLVRLYYENKQQSSYAARNLGIRHARGRIIAFVDADMWMERDWLSKVVDTMDETAINYLGCNVKVHSDRVTLLGVFNQLIGFPIEQYVTKGHYCPTCSLVVRSRLFSSVGVFDSDLVSGGDAEFGNRVYESGISLQYVNDIVVFHPTRNLKSLTRKYLRTGRGVAKLLHRYPDRFYRQKRKWYHLFLPLNPVWFRRKISDYERKYGRKMRLVWIIPLYCLTWYIQLVSLTGYFSEALSSQVHAEHD